MRSGAARPPHPDQRLFGIVIVLLGLGTLLVPAFFSSPRCWVATEGPNGISYTVVLDLPPELGPGQIAAGCDGGVPGVAAFPVAMLLQGGALSLAALSLVGVRKTNSL